MADQGGAREAVVRLPVAVLVVVATVVLALLAVWGTTVVDAERLPTGPPMDPPAAPVDVSRLVKTSDRDVVFQELELTLAGPPYSCRTGVSAVSPEFDQLAYCTFTTQSRVGGTGRDWEARTGVGVVAESAVVTDNLARTAVGALEALVAHSYDDADHAKITHGKGTDLVADLRYGTYASIEAHVDVSRKGLDTPYDKAVVLIVQLKSGRNVVFYSLYPHGASNDGVKAVVASLDSITATR